VHSGWQHLLSQGYEELTWVHWQPTGHNTLVLCFCASVTWYDLWHLETWLLVDHQLRCFELMGAGSWENITSTTIYPVLLWEDWPSRFAESLGKPHADQEPTLSILFRAGTAWGGTFFAAALNANLSQSIWNSA